MYLIFTLSVVFPSTNQALYAKISSGQYHFKSNWTNVSPLAVDLVKQLLVVSQLHRLTVDEALDHVWFKVSKGMG